MALLGKLSHKARKKRLGAKGYRKEQQARSKQRKPLTK